MLPCCITIILSKQRSQLESRPRHFDSKTTKGTQKGTVLR